MEAAVDQALEDAKIRLRESLSKMEKTVDKRIRLAGANTNGGSEELQNNLKQLNDENKHLRQEITNLQTKIGKNQRDIDDYKSINSEANKRVDRVIGQLEKVISE